MLIFLMVYNNINESEQVVIILYLTMKAIFGNTSSIWPHATIICKDKSEKIVVMKAID